MENSFNNSSNHDQLPADEAGKKVYYRKGKFNNCHNLREKRLYLLGKYVLVLGTLKGEYNRYRNLYDLHGNKNHLDCAKECMQGIVKYSGYANTIHNLILNS